MSNVLDVYPCCGGPSRRNLCRRFGTVTRIDPLPVMLCGMPNEANVGVGPRAAYHVTHSFPGIMTIGRTDNDLRRMSRVVGGGPSGFRMVDNSSTLAFSVVTDNTTNIVSIVNGTLPGTFDEVVHLRFHNRCRPTHGVRRSFARLCDLLFISNGPTNIGTLLGSVNFVRGRLHLPLIPAHVTAGRGVDRVLEALGVWCVS